MNLFSIANALVPKDLSSRRVAHDISYGPADRHKLDIYAHRRMRKPRPVVFFIYGGSWRDGDRRYYEFAGRALAALGYVTVIADYRLVPEVEYPGFVQDGLEAFRWVARQIGQFGGDPNQIAVAGHSAGAYNALMLVLDEAYLARAGLLSRVKCVVGLSGPYDFFPFDGPISLRTFGAVPDPRDTQPIQHAGSHVPPMFLGTGGQDRLVQPRNTVALAKRLRTLGVPVVERHYEKLKHAGTVLALAVPGRWTAPVLKDVAAFLREHLGE